MSEDILNADPYRYGQASALDGGPPALTSDPVVDATSPIEQLLRALGLAANAGDPLDDSDGLAEYALRQAGAAEASDGFMSGDTTAADELAHVQTVAGQIPQIAAGLAGAIAGALQPLTQIPAQLGQGAQQAIQTGAALVSQFGARETTASAVEDSLAEDPFAEDAGAADWSSAMDDDPVDLSAPESSTGSAMAGPTMPMAVLGAAPVPSAGTAPASAALSVSAAAARPAVSSSPPVAQPAGMTGLPMTAPMPFNTAGERAEQPDTKKVTVPPVRNGSPVQGRIAVPAAADTRRLEGRPVTAKRLTHADSDHTPA